MRSVEEGKTPTSKITVRQLYVVLLDLEPVWHMASWAAFGEGDGSTSHEEVPEPLDGDIIEVLDLIQPPLELA